MRVPVYGKCTITNASTTILQHQHLYDLYGRTQKLAFVLKFLLWQTTGDVIHNPHTPATLAADLTFWFFSNQRALTATC